MALFGISLREARSSKETLPRAGIWAIIEPVWSELRVPARGSACLRSNPVNQNVRQRV
jgi:hypothetical protein